MLNGTKCSGASRRFFASLRMTVLTRCYYTRHQVKAMSYTEIITIEPGKQGGKPCIRGMRMTVHDVLEYLAGGMSHEEILQDFPYLTEDDIRACLGYAADEIIIRP